MWELAEGPILPTSSQGFCLVPLWIEDMHPAHFPLANGKKTSCLWVSACIIQVLSACLSSVVTFPVLDLWGKDLPMEAIICFDLHSTCNKLHETSRESGRAVETSLQRRWYFLPPFFVEGNTPLLAKILKSLGKTWQMLALISVFRSRKRRGRKLSFALKCSL